MMEGSLEPIRYLSAKLLTPATLEATVAMFATLVDVANVFKSDTKSEVANKFKSVTTSEVANVFISLTISDVANVFKSETISM